MSGTALATQRVTPSSSMDISAGLPSPKSVSSSRLVPITMSIAVCRAVGDRSEWIIGQQDTIDDRKKWERDHPGVRTTLPHLFRRGHEFGRRDALECFPSAGRDAERCRQPVGRSFGVLERVHMHTAALHDGPAEEPLGCGRP